MLGRDNSGGSPFDRPIAALARVQQVWLRREKCSLPQTCCRGQARSNEICLSSDFHANIAIARSDTDALTSMPQLRKTPTPTNRINKPLQLNDAKWANLRYHCAMNPVPTSQTAAASSFANRSARQPCLALCFALLTCLPTTASAQSGVPAGAAPALQPVEAPRFPIVRFDVRGNTLLSDGEIRRRTAAFLGPRQNFADVQRALEALEEAYRAAGWGGVQVLLPEQTLESGVVQLQVVESRIARVSVEGARHHTSDNVLAAVPQLREGAVPRTRELQESIRLANENPSKQSALVLKAGAREGDLEAIVQVSDQPPQRFVVSFDNTGSTATGDYRLGLGWQHANLFDRDHVLNAQAMTSPTKPDRVRVLGLGYRLPFYGNGDVLDLSAGYSNVDSGTLLDLFSVSGAGKVASARYTFNYPRWPGGWEPRLAAGLDWRAYENRIEHIASGQRLVPDITVRPLSLTASLIRRAEKGDSAANLTLVRNLPGGSQGDAAAFAAARNEARDRYLLWRYGASHLGELASDWQWRASANGQWTRDALVPGEQFGLGGMDSVRGFRERELASDRGLRLSGELYTPDVGPRLGDSLGVSGLRLRALAFYDAGRIWRNRPLPGELREETVAAWGIGLRASVGRSMNLRLEYGRVLDAGGTQGKGDGRLAASMALQF